MSWSRGALLLLTLMLPLAGCGFHPLYAERAPLEEDPGLAAVKVASVPERTGQILTTSLRENFNPRDLPVEPRYLLKLSLTTARADLGIRRDATASRSEVVVYASYTLTDLKTQAQLYAGTSRSVGLFNFVQDGYATTVAAQDAEERAVRDLSQEISIDIASFVRRQRASN